MLRFNDFLKRIPKWALVLLAIFFVFASFIPGPHGVTLAVGLAAAPSTKTLGGGNKLYFRQLTKASDGTFTVSAVADVLGNAAGTWNVLGSHTETPWTRLETGQFTMEPTLVENDKDRKNLLMNVAPYTTTDIKPKPELDLEDGTVLQSGTNTFGDDTKPYFDFIYFQAPTPAGKEHVFNCVGQFDRATSMPFKINTYNLFKVKIQSVDAKGYITATPPSPETRLTGVTFVALTGKLAQGTVLEQA